MAREQKAEMGTDNYNTYQLLMLLFASHPPTTQRSMALSWESNFVKMPPQESRHATSAFDEMRERVKSLQWKP
jgi:hypothetical protein